MATEKSVHTVTWTIWASLEVLVTENRVFTPEAPSASVRHKRVQQSRGVVKRADVCKRNAPRAQHHRAYQRQCHKLLHVYSFHTFRISQQKCGRFHTVLCLFLAPPSCASPPVSLDFSSTYFEICHDSIKYSPGPIGCQGAEGPKATFGHYAAGQTASQAIYVTKWLITPLTV